MSHTIPEVRGPHPLDAPHRVRALVMSIRALLTQQCLCVVALSWFAVVLLILGPGLLTQDTWLALVAGREIVRSGLPHADTIALLTRGRDWVDQQWLAQTLFYTAHRVGGVGAVYGMQVVVLLATASLAMIVARRLGASLRSAALLVPIGFLAAPWGWDVRAQSLAYAPFVLVLGLLATSERSTSRRILLVLPVLALWANLHGSVLVGVALAVSWALITVVRPGRTTSERVTATVVGVGAPLLIFASPYGWSLAGYYRRLLIDPPFSSLILEWKRTTFEVSTVLFWSLLMAAMVLAARRWRSFSLFELITLVLLAALAIDAVRNIVWFGLAAALLLPRAVDNAIPSLGRRREGPHDWRLVQTSAAVLLICAVVAGSTFSERYRRFWPVAPAAQVATLVERNSNVRVYAGERLADWLLWEIPSMKGRVAYDARVELLTRSQVERIVRFQSGLLVADSPAAHYPIIVLSPNDTEAIDTLVQNERFRIIGSDERAVVLVRPWALRGTVVQASTG
jgi:hypothetical protein